MKLLAPSILSADFSELGRQIRLSELGGADWIHCDVMDGHFVPNITFGPDLVKAVRKSTKLVVDVHLMIENPEKYIDAFAKAGADYITIHLETVSDPDDLIRKIKAAGVKAGVSIKPGTPVTRISAVAAQIDLLLIMSVDPGFGGQSFIESSLNKISEAVSLRKSLNTDFIIEVDGGITKNNIQEISAAGCDVFVAGSAVFRSENITGAAAELKNLLK